eukprot:1318457-Amphidinium_carterae.1
MTIQELRANIQEEEERMAAVLRQRDAGYYVGEQVPPPLPTLQRWKDRLEISENQRQEEEDRLEYHRQVEQRVRQQEAAHLAE